MTNWLSSDGSGIDEHPGLREAFAAYQGAPEDPPEKWTCPECDKLFTFSCTKA